MKIWTTRHENVSCEVNFVDIIHLINPFQNRYLTIDWWKSIKQLKYEIQFSNVINLKFNFVFLNNRIGLTCNYMITKNNHYYTILIQNVDIYICFYKCICINYIIDVYKQFKLKQIFIFDDLN